MNHKHTRSKRQHGGALLVSIIMIFMMSILGISTMRGSTIERRMADNSVATNTNFQIAESSTEMSLNTPDNLLTAYAADGQDVAIQTTINPNVAATSWANLKFVGLGGAIPGWATGVGNTTTFVGARFIANGNSRSATVRADSEIEQGAGRPVPASPSP